MIENDLIYNFAKQHVIGASGLVAMLMPQTFGAGIAVKSLDGRYQLVNKAMENLLCSSTYPLAGMTDTDLFPAEVVTQLERSDQQIMKGVAAVNEALNFSVKGLFVQCLWLKFPVHGPDGQVLFIGAAVIDLARHQDVVKLQEALGRLQLANQELQRNLAELDHVASTDKLTGTWNRRRLAEALVNEMDRLRRYNHPLSLLIIDIDFFKKVNDVHGHTAGDKVLTMLASLVQSTLRTSDSLTRWGGEEFIVLCPNSTMSTAVVLAERLRESVNQTIFPDVGNITVSLGVAECISNETWEQWFNRADAALYRAKSGGRNQTQFAAEVPTQLDAGENVAANFVKLTWHPAYESGNTNIDDQHRGLFGDANKILGAMLTGRPPEEVAVLVKTLLDDVAKHFHDEEITIAAAGYPGAPTHAKMHQKLMADASELALGFDAGTLNIGELFKFIAHDVIARHILKADREYFPYLKAL
ncbi:MAG: diguanylate cyclase [Rhodoferax sp.]|nr:diguanylate cyclase [Rhodoferax sp.]